MSCFKDGKLINLPEEAYIALCEASDNFSMRSPEELEKAAGDLAKMYFYSDVTGQPKEWTEPMRVAARYLAEASAYRAYKKGILK